jgi:competence protein ComEC
VTAGAAGLVAGVFAAAEGPVWPWPLGIVATLACIAGLIAYRRVAALAAVALVGAFFFAGAIYWKARESGPPGDALARDAARQPENVAYELEGRVTVADVWLPGRDYLLAQLGVERATRGGRTFEISGETLLRWSEPEFGLRVGDRVRVRGELSLVLAHVNPGIAGPESYYRLRGVHTSMRISGAAPIALVSHAPWYDAPGVLSRFRESLARRLSNVIPESTLPFVLTVWLGDRRQLDSELYEAFIESGTAHILSVSGLHIAIIFASLRVLAQIAVRRRRIRLVVLLVSVAGVVMMTGAQVPTIRAALMIAIYLAAEWFEREPDAPTALAIAAALFVVHDPKVLYDVAFQLSFLSVASLLLFDGTISDAMGRVPYAVRKAISATLAVQLLPLPVAVRAFYVLPLAAPLVNLVVIPLTTVVLWLGFLTSVCVFVLPPAAPLFGYALHPFVQAVLWIVSAATDTGRAHVQVASPATPALFAYAVAVIAAVVATRSPARKRIVWMSAAAMAAVACIVLWTPVRPAPEITVLDVGHGDSIFVRAPGGKTMLVDAGQRSEYVDEGRRTVAPFLWANHETHLDVLMVTHPDSDHIGGAKYILEKFRVGSLVLGPTPFPGTLEDELIATCERRGVPVVRVAKGNSFALGRARVEVMHPPSSMPPDTSENDSSLVARVTWPGISVLLTGDIERTSEEGIIADGPAALVLKVPHHGSITSSSEAFIDAVHPSVAVISVAERGRQMSLSLDVVDRYRQRGIEVFRTDIVGGVRIRPREGRLRIEPARIQRGYILRE